MNVIGYAFEADHHCIDCTKARFKVDADSPTYKPSDSDENYIGYDSIDNEGNEIHPIFSTDEILDDNGEPMTLHCGDCQEEI